MNQLNADCPHFECLVRTEFLYNLEDHHGDYTRGVCFGIASIMGFALGFHVFIPDTGAVIGRLPLHALCSQPCKVPELEVVELWDCFSHHPAVHVWEFLESRTVTTWLKDEIEARGEYLFTVDWSGSPYADSAGDLGWKCAHILKLENGWYAAQPNNRILWECQATRGGPLERPDYKLNTRVWRAEGVSRYTTEGMFYGMKGMKEQP